MQRIEIAILRFLAGVLLLLCLNANGQEQRSDGQTEEPSPEAYVPRDLEDSLAELQRMLKPEDVQRMREGTEDDMVQYHLGLGTWLRNNWGLWRGSRLSEWFNARGIHHAEDMSGIILDSFWRRLQGKDIDFEGQTKSYRAYWAQQKEIAKQEQQKARLAARRVDAMLIGMSLERSNVPSVKLRPGEANELRARYAARYRDGVLLAIRQGDVQNFTTPGYFLNLADRSLHPIEVPEIEEMRSAIVVGGVAYFSGTFGATPVLMAISKRSGSRLSLPLTGSVPVLGMDGSKLLAVYDQAIYRREGKRWTLLYQGGIKLPRSGPPPRMFGHRVFFRDEGEGENGKRLSWLDLTHKPRLVSLVDDVGIVGSYGPRWENSFSYVVTRQNVLWATLGEGYAQKSLIRRSSNGKYALAVINNRLRFDGNLLGNDSNDEGLETSAVALDTRGRLIAGGDRGLYVIDGKLIRQFVSFDMPTSDDECSCRLDLSEILDLGGGRYLLCGAFGGIYVLERDTQGGYTAIPAGEQIGAPFRF